MKADVSKGERTYDTFIDDEVPVVPVAYDTNLTVASCYGLFR